jgi:16S rRNA (uracil1498-N3)-methyltransferase
MNLILFSETDLCAEGRITLQDDRFTQIKRIHRSSAGDRVRVGEIGGLIGSGCIRSIDSAAVVIDYELDQRPPEKLPLRIILALPRPKMMRRIVRCVAEFGVSELIVINSFKVEKSFWQSPALNPDNIRQYLLAGLQQSKDTVLPVVSFRPRFKPFVEDELPALVAGRRALLAHPGIGGPCPQGLNQAATLAIGPEGGFSDYEVDKFLATGFEGVNLGSRILRVENALTALVAKLY